jgi:hypothetical protein
MNNNDTSGIVLFMVIIMVITNWPGTNDSWVDRIWYSLRYGVSYDKVFIMKRPITCDFMYAPIGKKDCSFDASVILHPENKSIEVVWIKLN